MRIRFAAAFLLLVIVACERPLPAPTPAPTRPPIRATVMTYQMYLPIMPGLACKDSPKRGLAWSHSAMGVPKGLLCLRADMPYHTWGAVGGETAEGVKVSVIWADEKGGYDYLEKWAAFVGEWEARAGRPYEGAVLFANEPDRADQADMTAEEVARLFLEAVAVCPACRFVGPMYSAADDGRMVREVWDIVGELCGLPCPALDSLYAHSLHVYPRPSLNYGPAGRVDDLCELVDGGDCLRPIWLTEMGWRTCYPGVRQGFGEWLREAEGDSRVEMIFIYTTFQEPGEGCRFWGLLEWAAWPEWVLTDMGRGVVDG